MSLVLCLYVISRVFWKCALCMSSFFLPIKFHGLYITKKTLHKSSVNRHLVHDKTFLFESFFGMSNYLSEYEIYMNWQRRKQNLLPTCFTFRFPRLDLMEILIPLKYGKESKSTVTSAVL